MRTMTAILMTLALPFSATSAQTLDESDWGPILMKADALEPLETLLVSVGSETVLAEGFDGNAVDAPHNIKSASKTLISALVGIAISEGLLEGVDQPIAPILADSLPADGDPRLADITVGHLLSMQAGLTRTSNEYYARWVSSPNWVEYALAQPFVSDPGTGWQYSTGSTHLLSAVLTEVGGRSTRALAEDWLGAIPGFAIGGWDRDPQGVYLGGNNVAITPLALLGFGNLYLDGGVAPDGTQIIDQDWIDVSWSRQSASPMRGDDYGYGWFLTEIAGEPVRYAWGYGGQMLYVVPGLDLAVVITSDENQPSAGNGYLAALEDLLADVIAVVDAG